MGTEDQTEHGISVDGSPSEVAIQGLVIGLLIGLVESGVPLVSFPGNLNDHGLRARSLVQLSTQDVGRRVGLLFEGGDARLPIVVGCIADRSRQAAESVDADLCVDGRKVVVRALSELVLRCGKASIKMTSDGGIEIRGANLTSRATGRNRILGGSIDLN